MLQSLLFGLVLACIGVHQVSGSINCQPIPDPPSVNDINKFVATKFDYLIVGGGTAGVALASRLSANPRLQVGVIEAGSFLQNNSIINEPFNDLIATGNPLFDWEFQTEPQPQAQNRVIPVPRGKLLGGSSGINGLAFGRASSPEYDVWNKFGPNQSWNFKDLLPFFEKSETVALIPTNPYPGISQPDTSTSSASNFEGLKGPVNVSYNAFYPDVVPTYVETMNALGIATNANPDSGIATGIANSRASVDRAHGTRSYSPTAYYCGLPPRPNLHILLQAQATKVILSKKQSKFAATGVAFLVGSQAFAANATREVILSAGTVQTPQLLELSGIGNPTILNSFGIPTLINLPGVGENLQEHLFSLVQWQLEPGHLTFDEMRNNATFAAQQTALYASTGQGVLAATDSAVTFIPLAKLVSPQELSAMLAIFDEEASQPGLSPLLKMQLPIQRSWITGTGGNIAHVELIHWSRGSIAMAQGVSYITALAGISHPTSRGTVHIASGDPTAKPSVNPRFLSTQFDQRSLLNAMKYHQNVAQTPPLSKVIVTQTNPPANESDADLQTWIESTCQGGDHLIGTAAMAPQNVGGVVNAELIVYGTTNLRVVDASVIPLHIAAHTQSTVYAIAEKVAQMILDG